MMNLIKKIDRDLTGEIYNTDESWKVLKKLSSFGGRWGGTKSEGQAVNYMLKKFEEYGLDNPHLEEFKYLSWKRGTSKLEVIEPSEMTREIPCLGQALAPNGVVEAPLINCEWAHPDVFKELGDKIKGKIVLVRTRASHLPIPGKALSETDLMRYNRAIEVGAVGYIQWNQVVGQPAITRAMRANQVGEIPACGISYANGEFLMDLIKNRPVIMKMTEEDNVASNIKSWNVVGEIKGTSKADEIVFWGAHHDGRDINQGALNDASGATVAIEAARALAKHKGSFKRTLKIAIYSCECYGLIGSFAYVQSHKDEMEKIKFVLNLDASGRPGGSGMGLRLEGRPELLPFFKSIADDMKLPYDMAIVDRFSIGSDHVPFVLQGIPTGNPAVSDPERTSGWPPEMGIHNDIISWRETAEDTIDKTRPEFVRRDAITVARMMIRLANADEIPARRFTFEETKNLIEERGYAGIIHNKYSRTIEELAEYGLFLN